MATRKVNKGVLVAFLLDQTGSMLSVWDETINGFNSYVETLRKKRVPVRITLTKFNSEAIDIPFSNLPLKDVPKLTRENYIPAFNTPLLDAMGRTMVRVDGELKAKKKSTIRPLFVVLTDGFENASREYTREKIRGMVKEREALGWTFVFLGADQDAFANSYQYGFSKANTMNYSSMDTAQTYSTVASATALYVKDPESKKFFSKHDD